MSDFSANFYCAVSIARPYIEKENGALQCAYFLFPFSQMRGVFPRIAAHCRAIAWHVEVAP